MHESASRPFEFVLRLDDDPAARRTTVEREFEERLRESSSLAVRVAYGVLRNQQDAEDVAQEAFARAHSRLSQLRDRNSFRAWLVRMTWRLAIDRWRSDRRRTAREQIGFGDAAGPTPESMVVAQDRSDRLWRAIDDLPDNLREAIVLSAIQGYDVREVATLLGLPEGTVKSRLFLARKGLAQRLQCLVKPTQTR